MRLIFKYRLVNEITFVILIFLFFLLLLSPSDFGEKFSAETWKSWSASKILISEGRFIQNSLGPLYYLFLIVLSPLNYKYCIILEYFITHIFFLVCVYFLCRQFNQRFLGILLSTFLITYISFIESPKYILAAGFLILHFINYRKKYFNSWFSPFLLISFLINWGYLVFYLGHIFGKIVFHLKNKNFKFNRPNLLTIILLIILVCPYILKADKFYNNHYVDFYNSKYVPVNLNSPLEIGFFQIGNWKYSKSFFSETDLYKADWFITHKKYYGECRTLFCVLKNEPKIIVKELFNDTGYNLRMLSSLLFNKDILIIKKIYFIPFLIIFLSIIVFGFINFCRENKNPIIIFCIFFGTIGYLLALSLTTFSYRYSFPLIPIFILLLLYSNKKIPFLKKNNINFNFFLVFVVTIQLFYNIKDYSKNYGNKEFYKIDIPLEKSQKKTNYFKSEYLVFSHINYKQKILSTDSNWLSGFSDANPLNVYSLFSLPPIKGKNIDDFLDTFDVILLNYNIEIPVPSIGTQTHLRYELYLKDFLQNNEKNWLKKEIENYGYLFVKR